MHQGDDLLPKGRLHLRCRGECFAPWFLGLHTIQKFLIRLVTKSQMYIFFKFEASLSSFLIILMFWIHLTQPKKPSNSQNWKVVNLLRWRLFIKTIVSSWKLIFSSKFKLSLSSFLIILMFWIHSTQPKKPSNSQNWKVVNLLCSRLFLNDCLVVKIYICS